MRVGALCSRATPRHPWGRGCSMAPAPQPSLCPCPLPLWAECLILSFYSGLGHVTKFNQWQQPGCEQRLEKHLYVFPCFPAPLPLPWEHSWTSLLKMEDTWSRAESPSCPRQGSPRSAHTQPPPDTRVSPFEISSQSLSWLSQKQLNPEDPCAN